MNRLKGIEGFPQVRDTADVEGHSLLIMDMLGENLRTLKEKYGN